MVVIAVDMGASKIKGALVTSNLDVLYSLEVPTQSSKGKNAVIDNLTNCILTISKLTKRKISSIGLSMPGIIENGVVTFGGKTLYFLAGFKVKKTLEAKFKVPVHVINDADSFALAESSFGAGKNYDKVLGIIWGSGVGGGIVVKTKASSIIISGTEIGHIKIYDSLSKKRLFVEDCAGGLSVEKKFKNLTGKSASIREIYSSKDKYAKLLVNRMISSIAKAIAVAIQTINPDVIVLGGGVSNLSILSKLKVEVKKEILDVNYKKLNIKRFEISDDSGIFGAAIIALNKK